MKTIADEVRKDPGILVRVPKDEKQGDIKAIGNMKMSRGPGPPFLETELNHMDRESGIWMLGDEECEGTRVHRLGQRQRDQPFVAISV